MSGTLKSAAFHLAELRRHLPVAQGAVQSAEARADALEAQLELWQAHAMWLPAPLAAAEGHLGGRPAAAAAQATALAAVQAAAKATPAAAQPAPMAARHAPMRGPGSKSQLAAGGAAAAATAGMISAKRDRTVSGHSPDWIHTPTAKNSWALVAHAGQAGLHSA